MKDKLEFFATLAERGAGKIDADGAAVLKLNTDAQQLSEVLKLLAFGSGKLLKVMVEIQDAS